MNKKMSRLIRLLLCTVSMQSLFCMNREGIEEADLAVAPSIREATPRLEHYPYPPREKSDYKTINQLHFDRETKKNIDITIERLKNTQRIAFHNSLLLSGKQATGKKSLVYAMAHASGRDILRARLHQFLSIYLGSAAQNTKTAFTTANNFQKRVRRPLILFFENFELFCNYLPAHEEYGEAYDQLCSCIKWLKQENPSIFFIATYNGDMTLEKEIELARKCAPRDGVLDILDYHINLPLPDKVSRALILGDCAQEYDKRLAPCALNRVVNWTKDWDAHVLNQLFKTVLDEDGNGSEKTKEELSAQDLERAYKQLVHHYPDLDGRRLHTFFVRHKKTVGAVACSSLITVALLKALLH